MKEPSIALGRDFEDAGPSLGRFLGFSAQVFRGSGFGCSSFGLNLKDLVCGMRGFASRFGAWATRAPQCRHNKRSKVLNPKPEFPLPKPYKPECPPRIAIQLLKETFETTRIRSRQEARHASRFPFPSRGPCSLCVCVSVG